MSKCDDIKREIKKVIHGKDSVIEMTLAAVLAKGHILLEDIPGVGKTTLAVAFSRALGLDYRRMQFTPDVLPSDLIGFNMYDKSTGEFTFREGAVYTNLFLADEIMLFRSFKAFSSSIMENASSITSISCCMIRTPAIQALCFSPRESSSYLLFCLPISSRLLKYVSALLDILCFSRPIFSGAKAISRMTESNTISSSGSC